MNRKIRKIRIANCIFLAISIFVIILFYVEEKNKRMVTRKSREKGFVTLLYKYMWMKSEQDNSEIRDNFNRILEDAIKELCLSAPELMEQFENATCYVNNDISLWEKLVSISSDREKLDSDQLLSSTTAVYLQSSDYDEYQFISFSGYTSRGEIDSYLQRSNFISIHFFSSGKFKLLPNMHLQNSSEWTASPSETP